MANDGRVYDSTVSTIAMDAETHPSLIQANHVSSCVNRLFRRGINSTRPPFHELELIPAYDQNYSILEEFQDGNFQGAMDYSGLYEDTYDGIICSVSGSIFFIQISNNKGLLYKLFTGNDPKMMHTWFVQAEDRVYIQNGYQDPIAWDGKITGSPINLKAVGQGDNYITLTWDINTFNSIQTIIQVQSQNQIFTDVTSVPANVTTYDFLGLSSDILYSFRLRSKYPNDIFSDYSEIVRTTGANKTPTIPKIKSHAYRLNPYALQMPVGTIMAYCYGRVAVSDSKNRIFVSDILYGNGFTDTSNTENFTEQTYWAEGGSFTPPASLGQITGMRVMPSININVRGQGELVVFCENGAFTLDLSQDRKTWQDNNIQKVSLIGRGCRSPWSICGVNNDAYFRADDGWTFYNNAQVDFSRNNGFIKVSREVQPWVSYDTPWLKQFASSIYFDNFVIGTVSPFTVFNKNNNFGLHRPHRAMIVIDLERPSYQLDVAVPIIRWSGLWEGVQVTQLLTAYINGSQRAFAFSYDADQKNRLYELQSYSSSYSGVDDYSIKYGNVPIGSYFVTKRFDFGTSVNKGVPVSNKFIRKQLAGAEIWVSNIKGEINLSCEFRPDSYECWTSLSTNIPIGYDNCSPSAMIEDSTQTISQSSLPCIPIVSQQKYQLVKFDSPNIDNCTQFEDISLQEGAEFQFKVIIHGNCAVDRFRVSAVLNSSLDLPSGNCPEDFIEKNQEPIQCPCNEDLDFYRIIPLPSYDNNI